MKPHFIGYRHVGYVDRGKMGVEMFDANGAQIGVTASTKRARDFLRSRERVARLYGRDPGRYDRNIYS